MKYSSMKVRMFDKMAPGAISWVVVAVRLGKGIIDRRYAGLYWGIEQMAVTTTTDRFEHPVRSCNMISKPTWAHKPS